jgi:adenylylsulfate kinase
MKRAFVFWFTGLSGSGKTTIVDRVVEHFSKMGKTCIVFDGDAVRKDINRHLSFCPEDIRENNRIIAELCQGEMDKCDFIFVPIISPFQESRDRARNVLGSTFFLIYCHASLAAVMRRDPKGLYRKALSGEIDNFIGYHENVPYQPPTNADLVLDTQSEDVGISIGKIINFINLKTEKVM